MTERSEQLRTRIWLATGLVALFVVLSPGRLISFDAGRRLVVARALWSQGTVFVTGADPVSSGLIFPGELGRGTSFYGIGQTLAFLPFDMLGFVLGRSVGVGGKMRAFVETLPLVFVYAPLVGIAWWWAIARLSKELGLSEREALAGATVLLVGTVCLVYVSQSLQEEAAVGVLVTASLLNVARWGRAGAGRHAWSAGFCAGCALLFRLTAGFALLPVAGCALAAVCHGRLPRIALARAAGWASLGIALPLATHVIFAQWRFGDPLASGYGHAESSGWGMMFGPVQPRVAIGLLVGLGKGLLVLSPPLMLGAMGSVLVWARAPLLWIGVIGALVTSVIFHSRVIGGFGFPYGSEGWGARYQVHLVGFLAYPMTVCMGRLSRRTLGRAAVMSVVLLGLVFQVLGAFSPDTLDYCAAVAAGSDVEFLMSGRGGQLARKATTVVRWASGSASPADGAGCAPEMVARMQTAYVPNLWGPVYAKRLTSPTGKAAVLILWVSAGCVAVAGLVGGARRLLLPPGEARGARP